MLSAEDVIALLYGKFMMLYNWMDFTIASDIYDKFKSKNPEWENIHWVKSNISMYDKISGYLYNIEDRDIIKYLQDIRHSRNNIVHTLIEDPLEDDRSEIELCDRMDSIITILQFEVERLEDLKKRKTSTGSWSFNQDYKFW